MRKQIARFLVIVFLFTGVPLAETTESTVVSAAQESLPSAVTLVGTSDLPPIDSQGGVGCCGNNAVAYMQFTNAVSKYIHANYPYMEWDPSSGNKSNIFSPKYTYTLCSSSPPWIGHALKEGGSAMLDQSSFYKIDGGSQFMVDEKLIRSAVCWDNVGSIAYDAFNYRLKNYEDVSIIDAPYVNETTPKIGDKTNVMFTTSEAGRELIVKIKDAVNRGNVVVGSGEVFWWQYETVDNGGTLGKVGERAIVAASGTENNQHAVSIVGYDDDIEATVNGVKLKGAFLIANSWGEVWENNGYCWMMYDAINTVSEYPELDGYYPQRANALFGFFFTYWDRDIVVFEKPERMLKVDINVANREGAYIVLTMCDKATGKVSEYVPAVFYYGVDCVLHPDYNGMYDWDDDNTKWLTFSGVENGEAEQETFYFSYQSLIDSIPEGKTLDDYTFGAKFAASREATVVYSDMALLSDSGEVLQEKDGSITCVSTGIKDKVYGGNIVFNDVKHLSIIAENGEGYFFNYPSDTIAYGEKLEFTLSTARGYSSEHAIVRVNGIAISPVCGKYTVEKVRGNITLSVSGITKTQANQTTVNFYSGNTLYASDSYTPGERILCPDPPQKPGYTFVRWTADIYEQEFDCIEAPFPETMPGCSFNAYAVFEPERETLSLRGGRYNSGMEVYGGETVLLFKMYSEKTLYNDFWENRMQYDWVLHYTWSESETDYSFDQVGIVPSSRYVLDDTACLFRFEICNGANPFIPQKNISYQVCITVTTQDTIYQISGNDRGYSTTSDPVRHNENSKNMTVEHFFVNDNDFEYWSGKTYMTLDFQGIDTSVYQGNYLWVLNINDQNGNTFRYFYYANSFYAFSEKHGLVRFPVLEFGWVPQYGGVYQIDFSVFNGNQQVYTGSLSDVKCNYRYPVTWEIDGKTKTIDCPIGEMPVYDGATIYEIETGWYEHITWISAPKPATAPARYVSFGVNRTNDYTITFRTEDEIVSQKEYPSGFKIAMPENPVKKGYTFLGWTPKVISTATANRIYTAQFIPEIGDWDANSARTDDGTQYQLLYDRRRISVSSHPEDGSLVASRINTTSNRNSYFGAFTKSTYPILSGKYMLSQDFETEDGFASFGLSAEAESENLFGDAGNNRFVLYRSVSEGVTTFYVVIAGEKKPCCKINATTGVRMWTVGVTKQNGSYYMTVDGVAVTGSGYSEQVQSACKLENHFAEEFLGNNYSVHFLMYADCMNGDAYLHPSVTVDDNLILDVQNRCTDRNLGFDGTVEYNVPNYSLSTDGNRHIYRFEVPSAGSVTVTEPVNPKGFSIQASMAQSPGGKTVKFIFSNDPTFLSGNQISVDVYRYIRYYEGAVTLSFAQEDEITKLHISIPQGSVAIPPLDFSSLTGAPIYLKITGGAGSEPTVTLSNTTSVSPAYTTAAALAAATQNFLAAEAVANAQALDGFVREIYADAINWWSYRTKIHIAVAASESYTDRQKAALTATAELTELEAYIQSLETADATGIAGCRKGLLGFSYGDKNYDYYHDGVLDIRDLVRLKKIALMMYYEPIDDELPLDWD
ncbi:MAG: InlB B-repeat-containing protein [Clostridia bacterium]|nr:InlB B-repeat-containing protein [Clostridia bacterium]